MEFTTGLMSLDTALNEMLSRVTPLTAQETLPPVSYTHLTLPTNSRV